MKFMITTVGCWLCIPIQHVTFILVLINVVFDAHLSFVKLTHIFISVLICDPIIIGYWVQIAPHMLLVVCFYFFDIIVVCFH